MFLLVALVGAAVASASASAGAGNETAREFTVRVWSLWADGRPGEMWDLLHPTQQLLLPRPTFIKCMDRGPHQRDKTTVRATRTRSSSFMVFGTGGRLSGVAVSYTVTNNGRAYGPYVQNVAKFLGRWRWIMRGDSFFHCPAIAQLK